MIKTANSLAAVLFVWALVLAPAIHRLEGHSACESCSSCAHESHKGHEGHCPSHPPPTKHDAAHCSICQLAAMSVLAASPLIVFAPDSAPVAIPEFSFLAPAVPAARRLPFSCGPPA